MTGSIDILGTVDLVILSAGFILRLLGGAYAADVPVSDWFLIISLFGSLFIADWCGLRPRG